MVALTRRGVGSYEMNCESCGKKPAKIHTTDIVNNAKTERHLCEDCYKQFEQSLPFSKLTISGLTSKTPSIDVKLTRNVDPADPDELHLCDGCGLSLAEFRKNGSTGCARCYDSFAEEIESLLVKLHGGRRHVGKFPKDFHASRAMRHQLSQLTRDLDRAVTDERYEDAARLRDRIRALEEATTTDESVTDG